MTRDEIATIKCQHEKTGLKLDTASGLSGTIRSGNGCVLAPVTALIEAAEQSLDKDDEIDRLRSELHSIRDTTIEDCAAAIRDHAKVAGMIGGGGGGISIGLELAEASVRALKDKNPREE